MKRTALVAFSIVILATTAYAQRAPKAPVGGSGGAASDTIITLPKECTKFAINSKTGVVAGISQTEALVRIFPKLAVATDASQSTEVKVGASPIGVGFATLDGKGTILVLCKGDRTLYMIDEATKQVTTKVAISSTAKDPVSMTVAQAAPYLFYATEDQNLGRVDLAAKKDEGLAEDRSNYRSREFSQIEVSADGKYVYNRRANTSPSGVMMFPVKSEGGKWTITNGVYFHDSMGMYVPDPWGFNVAAGNRLYSYDLSDSKTLDTYIVCFVPSKAAYIGRSGDTYKAYSYNTHKEYGTVNAGNSGSGAYSVLVDEKNENLLRASGNGVVVVPLKSFELPDEPLLVAKVEQNAPVWLGETLTLKVTPLDSRAKITLPQTEGAKLEGTALTWTPKDASSKNIEIVLSSGSVERKQSIPVVARRKTLDLPFLPTRWTLTDDGKTIVALSSGGNRDYPQQQDTGAKPRVIAVDVQKGSIVFDRTLPSRISAAAIDNDNVYVTSAESDALLVLNRKDPAADKRVFTKGSTQSLNVVGGKALVAVVQGNNGLSTASYKLPELTPIDSPPADTVDRRFGYGELQRSTPTRMAGGWYDGGVLWDLAYEKPRAITRLPEFTTVSTQNNRMYPYDRQVVMPAPWGTTISGNIIMRGTQKLATVDGNMRTVMVAAPAALFVSDVKADNNNSSERRAWLKKQLSVRDLANGEEFKKILLLDEPANNDDGRDSGYGFGDGNSGGIQEASGVIALQFGRRIVIVTAKELGVDALPVPLHFKLEQSAFTASAKQPTTVSIAAVGGKAPVTYALTVEQAWLDIDKATGKVTIDNDKLIRKAAEYIAPQFQNSRTPIKETLAKMRSSTATNFKRITGEAPTGVPIVVTVGVTATDALQATIATEQSFIVDVPEDMIVGRIPASESTSRPAVATSRPFPFEVTSRPAVDLAAPLEENARLKTRIADLERQNIELQAQNKLLKELLTKPASTQP